MPVSVEDVVAAAVRALKLELVEVERAPRGLLRVFIDRPAGKGAVTVEDCADVSNQLTHQFLVEGIEYERLEVSSPGLDRVLKTADDFRRFGGQNVKVRLNTMVENRKRFEATVVSITGDAVTFALLPEESGPNSRKSHTKKAKATAKVGVEEAVQIVVKLDQIEKARLIPDL
jgi:ribosome maturation factor RimP